MLNQTILDSKEFSIKKILPALIATIVGMLLVMLDSTIMNVAIPHLEIVFKTDLNTIQWVVTGYTLALSVVIPLAGWFSDRFTSKRVFLTCIIAFTLGSLLCSFAQTANQLILFRIIQGLGGGMITSIAMALTFRLAPPEKRGSIMGILGLPMLIAPILGPVLSGWILQYATWHWIFLVNLPVGIIAFILGIKFLPVFKSEKNHKLDVLGMIFAPLAFSSVVYGIHNGGSEGWSNSTTIISLVFGLFALSIFIFVELRQKEPLLEIRSFSSIEFTKSMILTWVNQVALFGSIFLIPIFLQQVRGFTSFQSGLLIMPQAIMSFTGIRIGGKLFDKYGVRPVVFAGISVITCALALLGQIQADASIYTIIIYLAILGLGQGLTLMQLNTHVLKCAPKDLISRVTPLTASIQQVVGSIAVVILSGLLTTNIGNHMSKINVKMPGAQTQAMVAGFHDTLHFSMILAICGVVLSLFLRQPKNNN